MDTANTVQFTSALGKAIATWSQGKHIPLTLAVELIEEGYDLNSLQRRHFKR